MTKPSKKITFFLMSFILLLIIAAGAVISNPFLQYATAATDAYYHTQLVQSEVSEQYPGADMIYEALEGLDFASGAKTELSNSTMQMLAEDYVKGGKKLFNAFGAAVGSFRFDHTEYFYVDFNLLSYNVYKKDASYVVEIGAGRAKDYFVEGATVENIPTLTEEYETALAEAVTYVNQAQKTSNYTLTYMRALYANRYLCNSVTYGFGTDANGKATEKAPWIATPYGALVNGECICEGYSRAFKAIMDKLGEDVILVTGYLLSSDGGSEPHMWNTVKNGTYTDADGVTGDAWYAVDVTANDTSRYASSADQWSNGDYFMVTEEYFEVDHIYEKKISDSDYEMPYPKIVRKSVQFKSGFISADYVEYTGTSWGDGQMKGEKVLAITLTKPILEMENDGYYPAFRSDAGKWSPLSYCVVMFGDTSSAIWHTEGNVIYYAVNFMQSQCEFAIGLFNIYADQYVYGVDGKTVLRPGAVPNCLTGKTMTEAEREKYSKGSYSQNAVNNNLIEMQEFYNPNYNPTYVIPAFVDYAKSTPQLTMKGHDITKTLDVKVVYTQKLKKINEEVSDYESMNWVADPFFRALDPENVKAVTKLENFHWDGESTFTFSLTVPIGYQYNRTGYVFTFPNFVGDYSDQLDSDAKTGVNPNNFGIYFRFYDEIACTKCSPDGKMKINTYGMPILTSTSDLSLDGWTYEDDNGETKQISENQRSQLALVVNTLNTENDKGAEIKEAFEKNIATDKNVKNDAILSSSTYEIDLTLCGKYANIPSGSHVTVNFGFPEGMSANDSGVTFKVYHFKKVNGVLDYDNPEILDCIVTEYGITVYMDSFSPFVLVAFDSDKITSVAKKGIVVDYNAIGGNVQGSVLGTTATLVEKGGNAVYNIIPKEGYEVEYAMLNGNMLTLNSDKNAMSYTFGYDILAENNVLSVGFVAKSVKETESAMGLNNTLIENIQSSGVVVEMQQGILPQPEDVKDINNLPSDREDSAEEKPSVKPTVEKPIVVEETQPLPEESTDTTKENTNGNSTLKKAAIIGGVIILLVLAIIVIAVRKKRRSY